jgi:Flp pilus assembly protein TadG
MDRKLRQGGQSLGRRGQALVETALVMPLLLLTLVGIMEIGRAWSMHQVVTDSARQGARKAAIWHQSGTSEARDSGWAAAARSLLAGSIDTTKAKIDVDPGTEEATVTVGVEYRFVLLGPVMALASQSWDTSPDTLWSSAIMRNE